jgi:hypothetical protein
MADRLTNIELLIMLSEDVKSQGDELSTEMHQRCATHARRVGELRAMLDKARDMMEQEFQRYERYLPQRPRTEPMPRVVQQGPKQQPPLPDHLRPKAANAE